MQYDVIEILGYPNKSRGPLFRILVTCKIQVRDPLDYIPPYI